MSGDVHVPAVPAVIEDDPQARTPSESIVLPYSGELIPAEDAKACIVALDELRRMESSIGEAKRALSQAIAEECRRQGTKSITIAGGRTAEVRGGTEKAYDAEGLERDLRALGMPEERLREIVTETVSYSVKAVEAKRAANANEEYARAIERNTTEHERPISVTIRRR
jgi:hypothetical protein